MPGGERLCTIGLSRVINRYPILETLPRRLGDKDMQGFQISPKTHMTIAIIVAVLTLMAKGTVAVPMGIPTVVGDYLTSWSNLVLQFYAVIAPFMAAYSSSQPGPLAPPDPPAVVAASKASGVS